MKNFLFTTLLSLFTLTGVTAQTDTLAQSKISELSFIAGNWKGSGWMMGRDGEKHTFQQTEKVQFKLDNTVLFIEGVGKSDGMIIHNAMAIVSYTKADDNYTFQSYLQNGRKGEFKAEMVDGKFYWYPGENIRYVISLNDEGRWYEVGEMNREGTWFQFFEMTLDKE